MNARIHWSKGSDKEKEIPIINIESDKKFSLMAQVEDVEIYYYTHGNHHRISLNKIKKELENGLFHDTAESGFCC